MKQSSNSSVDLIVERLQQYIPNADVALIRKAYDFANEAHEGQKRRSSEPYISHPVSVAEVLSSLEVDETAIAAALLHDVIEDANISKKTIEQEFGHEIAYLVEGVTKLGKISFGSREELQAENFRKMFLAMANDIRVIIIKLADRLHNMRTLKYLSEEKQKRIARETMDVYAPLAHRLGIGNLKWELEDLAFRYLNPEKYNEIRSLVKEKRVERERYIDDFVAQIKHNLTAVGIEAAVYGRAKHFWSIYNKIITQNIDFMDLYDLFAIRVIANSVRECYSILGVVHSMYKPIPGRFKDYIAMPKSNMYQSLHTTVIGPKGHPVEIQIRTPDMHRLSEYGIAAHWKYKDGIAKDKKFEMKLSWLRQLIDWQRDFFDAKDYMSNLKLDLFTDEAFVFTPKGDVHALPLGSTPIDFAYHIHTEVGHRCIGAKVNGKMVPLNYKLNNGDIVEIITSKVNNPKQSWLTFLVTNAAKSKVKQWFRKQNIDEKIKDGREAFMAELRKANLYTEQAVSEDAMRHVLKTYDWQDEEDIYLGISQGDVNAKSVIESLKKYLAQKQEESEPQTPESVTRSLVQTKSRKRKTPPQSIRVQGMEDIMVNFARCCSPIPGDEIVGYITRGHGITIHRAGCHNVSTEKEERSIAVSWNRNEGAQYAVEVRIEGIDKIGLLKEVLNEVANLKLNVIRADVQSNKKSNTFVAKLTLETTSVEELDRVLASIRQIREVAAAYRVQH